MQVDCGHCSQCFKKYQDQWTARFNEEIKCWKRMPQGAYSVPPVVFFTLKYRNDTIPCRYLVLYPSGWRIEESRPYCRVLEFWTDTRRESRAQWLVRRKAMLEEYTQVYRLCSLAWRKESHARERCLDAFEVAYLRTDRMPISFDRNSPFWDGYEEAFNPFDVDFMRFPDSLVEHPVFDCGDLPRLDIVCDPDTGELFEEPILALEFHTVEKSHVQSWLKRCRMRFERAVGKVGKERMITSWKDSEGHENPLPTSALCDTFKYFITSEYGPKTYRPHLHGCLFGVTYEEFEKYFLPDWQDNYGSVEFSLLRPTGGAMTYLAKYCSKGHYEHPYCCRDFVYTSGKEYHSEHFEQCLADFNIDENMVLPTFHLISKGIGLCYAFQYEVLDYFGVELSKYVTPKGSVKYAAFDAKNALANGHCPAQLNEVFVCSPDLRPLSASLDIVECPDGSLRIRKYDNNGYLTGESVIPFDSVLDRTLEEYLLNKKYSRTYVKTQNSRTAQRGTTLPRWHFVGLPGLGGCKTSVTSISLPRYYRKYLLSPLASALRSSAARRLHSDGYEEAARLLRKEGHSDTVLARCKSLMDSDEIRNQALGNRLRERSRRDFLPCGVYEID